MVKGSLNDLELNLVMSVISDLKVANLSTLG